MLLMTAFHSPFGVSTKSLIGSKLSQFIVKLAVATCVLLALVVSVKVYLC